VQAYQFLPGPRGEPFRVLAQRWLETEGKRLVCPDNEARHIKHMKPLWKLREGELTPRRIKEAFFSLLRANGGRLSPATVNKLRSTGRRVVRDAQENGEWLSLNPFEVVRRQREEETPHLVLNLVQVPRVFIRLREDRRREAMFMLVFGCRPGELKGLRKQDIDRRNKTITFRRSNGRDSTKTGKVRVVPVPHGMWTLIREAIHASRCEYLFPKSGGEGRQRADTKLSRTLRTALARARIVTGYRYTCRRKGCGIIQEDGTFDGRRCPKCGFKMWRWPLGIPMRWYELRHSAATLHEQAGCALPVIQRALGHSMRSTTRRYLHPSDEYVRRELGKLVRKLRAAERRYLRLERELSGAQ
jgi:integrase